MTANKTELLLPPIVPGDYRDQWGSFFKDAWQWIGSHWLHILIATGIAVVLVALLRLARHWGVQACRSGDGTANWYAIFGRALGKTGNFFMVMLAARLVVGYAHAPAAIGTTANRTTVTSSRMIPSALTRLSLAPSPTCSPRSRSCSTARSASAKRSATTSPRERSSASG